MFTNYVMWSSVVFDLVFILPHILGTFHGAPECVDDQIQHEVSRV